MQNLETSLSATLDTIDSQQAHLEADLDAFEAKMTPMFRASATPSNSTNHGMKLTSDDLRENTYRSAETLCLEVAGLEQQVSDMVEKANRVWQHQDIPSSSVDDDPV